MTQARADVVICGGGVIGAAVAYFLAKRGVRPVIVEADALASGASGAAAGLLSPSPAGDEGQPLFELRRRSFELHEELARTLPLESGVDYGYSRVPRLAIATTEEEERTGRLAAERMRDAGRQGRWLGPAESARRAIGSTARPAAACWRRTRASSIRIATRWRWSPLRSAWAPPCAAVG